MRKVRIRWTVVCAVVLLACVSWSDASAQQAPWRIVQGSDGTLYLVTGNTRVVVTPDQITDDDLAALTDGGTIGGQLPMPPIPAPVVVAAPAPPEAAAPAQAPPTAPPLPAPAPPAAPPASSPSGPTFGEGTKILGEDLAPGTYRGNLQNGSSCYWARLSGLGGSSSDILANDNARGPAVVTIASSDKGFQSSRCGTWTQSLSPITDSQSAPFSDGTFIVGTDIAPGTWRADDGSGCYWARLSGFAGTSAEIIANANPRGSVVVQIAASDKGFKSARCGTWQKS